jgi:hypothetical protein
MAAAIRTAAPNLLIDFAVPEFHLLHWHFPNPRDELELIRLCVSRLPFTPSVHITPEIPSCVYLPFALR